MVHHFINLVVHSLGAMPSRVGSNWGGVVFTFTLFMLAELAILRWGEMNKERWGLNALIGLGAVIVGWVGLFSISVFLNIHDDHRNLSGASVRLKRETIDLWGRVGKLIAERDALKGENARLNALAPPSDQQLKTNLSRLLNKSTAVIDSCRSGPTPQCVSERTKWEKEVRITLRRLDPSYLSEWESWTAQQKSGVVFNEVTSEAHLLMGFLGHLK